MKYFNFDFNFNLKLNLKFFFVILFLFSFCATYLFATKQEELQKIKEDLNNKKIELENSKAKEKQIKKEVTYISGNLRRTMKNIKILEKSLNERQTDYKDQNLKLQQEKNKEEYYRKILRKELEFLYKQKFVNNNAFFLTLNAFFFDADFYKEIEKEYNIKTFLFYNKNKYKKTLSDQNIIQTNQQKIKNEITNLSKKKDGKNQDKISLLNEKKTKQQMIKEEKGKQKNYQKQIEDLSKAAKKLESFIRDLSQNKRGNLGKYSDVIAKFGYISMPVDGSVIVTYGKNKHPKYDTYRISNGVEIKTAKNASVKAVLNGKVVFCDKFSSYGNTVIIEHPEQVYTVYAYLDSISVSSGMIVSKGTVLGYSGFSNVSNVDALYFEVRLNGVAMDPEVWIKK